MGGRSCGGARGVRANALWGKGGRSVKAARHGLRHVATLGVGVLGALMLSVGAAASPAGGSATATYVAPGVYQAAKARAGGTVRVIIQSASGVEHASGVARGLGTKKRDLALIDAVVAELPAKAVERLAAAPGLIVTLDAPVALTGSNSRYLWAHQVGAPRLWAETAVRGLRAPAIAIVDSGIDTSTGVFEGRVASRRVLTDLPQASSLDGRGHGTLVASFAAGGGERFAGVSPSSTLVDYDVIDDSGMALTSDVIAAAQQILADKDAYGIRVANFSLHSTAVLSIRYHPLNKAVEQLWLNGIVVVAASGNYGSAAGPSGVVHAPGNDPFVITVGAADLNGTGGVKDDTVAPWSAYGYTREGFAKPDVVAAGRYMVGPVSTGSRLAVERPEKLVEAGAIELSGTSFAAPIVAGIAAQILARHPEYTPDQVKGAIMKTARRINAPLLAQGRGEVNAVRAAHVKAAPVANVALNAFVVRDPITAEATFDAAAWYDAVRGNATWDSAAWHDAAWYDAAWHDAAWNSAAWHDGALDDAAWNSVAWHDAIAYADNAAAEGTDADVVLTPEDALVLDADPDLALPTAP